PLNIPIVLQWNKRDLPTAVPVGEMRDNLNPDELPEYEAVAVTGEGVFETLKSVSKAVIKTLS
ncbi:MAG TPA: gliding-motility protein MglA, partial [Longimicrobiales bacterium]